MLNVPVDGGNYAIVQDKNGLRATRYGEPWRDCTGDNLILCLAMELERSREACAAVWAEYQSHMNLAMDPTPVEEPEGFGLSGTAISKLRAVMEPE